MSKNLTSGFIENKKNNCNGDTFILLIDHDIASISSLTPMLKQLSYKVINVNVASEAVSMLKKQMDIILVIANTEMPHINSHSLYTSLLTRDIPLILISPEGKKIKPSNSLEKRVCYFLEKPISEKDINNMLQHVLSNKSQKLTKISIPKRVEGNTEEERMNQIQAFRENIKRQRTSQSSLLGKQLLKKPFIERRNIANDEWKNNTVHPVEFKNKRNEGNNIDSNIGVRNNFWTYEHQMKFFSASSNLGDKAQVDRTDKLSKNKLSKNENPSGYKYPFTLSNIAKNFFSDKNPIKERDAKALNLKMDLSNNSCFGNKPNSSSMEAVRVPAATSNIPPCNISLTDTVSYTNLVSTSLNDNNFLDHSGLPLSIRASHSDMILSTVQNDFIHCEPSHTSLNSDITLQSNMTLPSTNINDMGNVNPPETNIEDISQVQQDACYDVPIEDMISFDTDVHKMDMQYVLGNHGSSEVNIFSNTQVSDEAYNTPMEEKDHLQADNEDLDWIDDVFNADV
ncbi:hypothetical protein N665_0371s0029 [Sinapis alba]|nr:hypothetical protein N665_0371s0029 [Sinapis alba]